MNKNKIKEAALVALLVLTFIISIPIEHWYNDTFKESYSDEEIVERFMEVECGIDLSEDEYTVDIFKSDEKTISFNAYKDGELTHIVTLARDQVTSKYMGN